MSQHCQRTYDFCLRFFSDLRACGVERAVISPGSRSAPLALSARAAGLEVTVQLDERVAAFHALGQAKATGLPSVLICTSGTAGANYFPAVIEAHHSGVPLIVCTADRPAELRQWGAGQTIDQVHMFGPNVRWFHEVPTPSEVSADRAGVLALRAVATALHQQGPVHLNWPLREPLEPTGPVVAPASALRPVEPPPSSAPSELLAQLGHSYERGLIAVGPDSLSPDVAVEIAEFANRWGWPIVADPASGLRSSTLDATVITTAELLLASATFTDRLSACDVIVRVGSAPTSKAYRLWVESSRPVKLVLVAPTVEWADPTASMTDVVPGPLHGVFATEPAPSRSTEWTHQWQHGEQIAAGAVQANLAQGDSELSLAHRLVASLTRADRTAMLMVSNSMPIRDLDVAMRRLNGSVRVVANRGANGIDGIVATASGLAQATGDQTVVFLGDVALVHDLGGLAAAARLGLTNLTVVVVHNDAGGIFSFLPVAQAVDSQAFQQLFATPHGTDIAAVGRSLGFAVTVVDTPSAFEGLADTADGPRLVVVGTSTQATVLAMAELRRQVAEALATADR